MSPVEIAERRLRAALADDPPGLMTALRQDIEAILAALADAELRGWRAGRDAAARFCDGSVVGGPGSLVDTGTMWRDSQSIALARAIRQIPEPVPAAGETA